MNQSLYLGKNFSFYFEGREKEERIIKLLEEIEILYNSLKLTQKNHGSIDLHFKKFKEFINDNENRKEIKKIKDLLFRLEEIFRINQK